MTNKTAKPLFITMDDRDNVAIVVNDGGLPAGTMFSSGLTLVEKIPQAIFDDIFNDIMSSVCR